MSMTKPAGNPEAPGESRRSRFGCLLTLAVIAFWWYLLHDFVSPPVAIALALAGAALIRGGLYLSVAGARYVFDSVWYAGAWLVGLLMLAGAAATLTPAAPGDLLTSTASGWGLLSGRAARLENAITEGDVELAAKIARRGLGDPAVRDGFGTPVLHYAKDDPEMLGALLEAGLDPDARDGEGRTLLAKGVDDEVRRLLLEAGAAPTPEPGGTAMTPGRDDWLVAAVAGAQPRIPSGISVTPDPLHPGEPGTVTLVVDNPTSQDRLLDVRATLDYAIFLIGASHGGALMDVGIPGTSSTVRWPALALPAGARGELQMRVLARSDDVVPGLLVGDLSIDARVLDLAQRTEEILQHSQQRAGTPARAAITSTAGLLVQLVPSLVVAMVLWVVWRRTRATYSRAPHLRFGRFVAGGAALICAAAAAGIVWSSIEPYVRFDEASCRVLDRRVFSQEVRRSSTERAGAHQRTMQLHPVVAVAIDTGRELRYAAGMATGGVTRSVQELRHLPVGLETRCWIDPRDPSRFTVVRGMPMAAGAGLTMLLVVTVVLGLIATRLGRTLERAHK